MPEVVMAATVWGRCLFGRQRAAARASHSFAGVVLVLLHKVVHRSCVWEFKVAAPLDAGRKVDDGCWNICYSSFVLTVNLRIFLVYV